MALSNRDQTSFLDLPTEVRLSIYDHYLQIAGKSTSSQSQTYRVTVTSGNFLVGSGTWPLFRSCKSVYNELVPVYYGTHYFYFNAKGTLQQAVSRHELFRRNVRHVVISQSGIFILGEYLTTMVNLRTLTYSYMFYKAPAGIRTKDVVEAEALRALVKRIVDSRSANVVRRALHLRERLSTSVESHLRDLHVLAQIHYYTVNATGAALGYWTIDYNCTTDSFTVSPFEKPQLNTLRLIP